MSVGAGAIIKLSSVAHESVSVGADKDSLRVWVGV